jgi:Zn-dependent alcohol dehydrogenase
MKMGATDFINPNKLPEGTKIQDHLVAITDGGLDYTFDCTGNVNIFYIDEYFPHFDVWNRCTL